MPYQIKIKDRIERIEILDQKDTLYHVKIGERTYQIDVVKVENGVYSVIYKGKSTNMEMIEAEASNKYIVNTRSSDYRVEIIDAKARYSSFGKSSIDTTDTIIQSPMPGKIVRIGVKIGDQVKKGDTVIVVSAMKMESEYKSPIDGKVSKIMVKPEQTVEGNQALVEIEPLIE